MIAPHPFLSTSSSTSFPPQLLPQSQKTEDWQKACMDALEALGYQQLLGKQKIRENYLMIKGELIPTHYENTEDNEYQSLVQLVQQETNTQINWHHFDFTRQVVTALVGELIGHPDSHKARATGAEVDNARIREKARLLEEWVTGQINAEINLKLAEQGLDPTKSDFDSPEQQQQYTAEIEQAKQALTPQSIQEFTSKNWKHVAEIWANIVLKDARSRYELNRKEQVEFEDMLTSDSCYRHFYLTGTGFSQETWNPLDTFHSHNPDQTDVEKGDYVGRIFTYSLAEVIDKLGHLLTGDQLEELYGHPQPVTGKFVPTDWHGHPINYTDPGTGTPYGTRVPWQSAEIGLLPQVSQRPTGFYDALFSPVQNRRTLFNRSLGGNYIVTEGYWKSQKKVGKLTWINPETGEIEKVIVDESVVLPPDTPVKEGNLYDGDPDDNQPGIRWTWINEIWGGIKITPTNGPSGVKRTYQPIYLNVKPAAFQGKPDAFVYDAELPVVGSIFNARNGPSQSTVDLIKPFQIAYNLFLNQAYRIAEEEILPFLLMDINLIPKLKDWGGEDGFEKWMSAVRDIRMAPADTRPSKVEGANTQGGQLPQVINLDATNRMIARFELAQKYKLMALEQIGMSPQRMANTNPDETATGVQTAMQRSYVQTAPLFTKFYNYIQRTLKKTLDFAQYVAAHTDEIIVSALNSDNSTALLKINKTDLLLPQLGVFVSNSQQDLRDLEIGKQLALENTTTSISPAERFDMATLTSVEQVRETLRRAQLREQQQLQQQQQLEQQKLQQAQQMQATQLAHDDAQREKDRQARKEEAFIKTFGFGNGAIADSNDNGMADAFEYARLNQAQAALDQKQEATTAKTQLDQLKLLSDQQKHQDNLLNAQQERASREKIAQDKIKQARIQGDKSR